MRIDINSIQSFSPFSQQTRQTQTTGGAGANLAFSGAHLNISEAGMSLAGKLRVSNEKIPSTGTEANLMTQTISEVENILKEMKTLASVAEDETISDERRIDMQIQMTKLQAQLYKKIYGMSLELASKGGSGNFNANLVNAVDYDENMTIKLLERERVRLTNGEGLESGESVLLEQRVALRAENGPESYGLKEMYFDEELGKVVVSDEWSVKSLQDGTTLITGQRASDLIGSGKVISDEDRLAQNNLSLMDPESAKKSAKKLQRQLTKVERMSGSLTKELESASGVGLADYNKAVAAPDAQSNAVMVGMGLMRSRQTDFGENPLRGKDLDSADVRLASANGAYGEIYQKLDDFLKDGIHKTVGLGGLWDNIQNITYV
jgi:hypothetical protein